jgi:SAM-dependent methyltransferase
MTLADPKLIQPYERLAFYYDELMDYIDYIDWTDLIVEGLKDLIPGKNILDVSCGTGTMCYHLSALGYEVSGVDSSLKMVELAKSKYSNLRFSVGDMRNIQLTNLTFDAILNVHDGLNYLHNLDDILAFLTNSKSMLSQDGVLVFDVATPRLCRQHFNEFIEIHASEENVWERHTHYDARKKLVQSDFIFLDADGHATEKETHLQIAYNLKEVNSFLELSPFKTWDIFDEETLEIADENTERLIIFAQ